MNVVIDGGQLGELVADAKLASAAMRGAANRALRSASFAVEKRVKQTMPVDSGRARASWGHWTPADLRGVRRSKAAGGPSNADAVWKEDELSISQGSNVPYIERLNAGHSRQAPAGFLDSAQLAGQVELMKSLGLIDPLDPNLQWLQFAM